MAATQRFDEIITSEDRLREIIGPAMPAIDSKVLDYIHPLYAKFVAASPYLILGSFARSGGVSLSPKGDAPGFVRILDDKTLLIPERTGNRRVDTLKNLLESETKDVGIIFLIPGHPDTLRVTGKAQIVLDEKLQTEMASHDRAPLLLISVTVETIFMHCAKSILRSRLWSPDAWPSLDDVPRLSKAYIEINALEKSREHVIFDQIKKDESELF